MSPGDRLGRFEILGALGAGGMGEVYRARDPQLQRVVAIKVLPPEYSNDADRRRRFEQEARAAGSLNHPNILAVYDVGLEGASSYIVTELLEGETLRKRMAGRPLPARKAVEYAQQIASGLAAGHEHGVVHRDIKPENLFVTTEGRIKILDFGLAKLIDSPTGSTETIMIDGEHRTPVMGTVLYMSPEQAQGLRIDHRTDIFSLGTVLYEMLAGVSPFRRTTMPETMSAILHEDPPELPASVAVSPAIARVVRHCLEKKPDERFQHARDLMFDLESTAQDPVVIAPARGRRGSRTVMVLGSALALAAAAAAVAFVSTRWRAAEPSPAAHRVRLMTNSVGLEEFPSISPDGKQVAFTSAEGDRRQILVRLLAGGPPLSLTSDEADHEFPRWLPDGSSLVYFSPAGPGEVQGAINRIPALGGSFQRVISSIGGGDVSKSGRVTCFRLQNDHIELVTSTIEGSDVQVVARLDNSYHRYPRWSPDGQWIAFQAGDGLRWDIYVIAARGGAVPTPVTKDNNMIGGLAWLPDSSGIVYASSRGTTVPYLPPLALWEASLDGRRPPRQLTPSEAWYEQPDVHSGGLVSAVRTLMRFNIWKYPIDAAGAENVRRGQLMTRQTGQVMTPTAAPDGDQIAYLSDTGGHANLWVTSSHGPLRQITFEDDPAVAIGVPIWSPDGRWIAFVSSKGNVGFGFGIWLVKPDGGELHQLVAKGLGAAWSPQGDWLYYVDPASGVVKKIAAGGGESIAVSSERARNVIGVHGANVYYVVERALMDGRPEFEIRAAPGGNGPARVIKTIPASRVPSWQIVNPALSPDGKWLAMPLTDGVTTNIWALSTDDGRWQQVTDFGDRAIFIARRVSWSSDGRSILAAIGEGDADIVVLDGLIKGAVK